MIKVTYSDWDPYKISLEDLPPLESITLKNIQAYDFVKRDFTEENSLTEKKMIFIHDYMVEKLKRVVFLMEGIEDKRAQFLVPKMRGEGIIKFSFKHELTKDVGLIINPYDFDNSYYCFVIGDRIAKLPVHKDITFIRKIMKQFLDM